MSVSIKRGQVIEFDGESWSIASISPTTGWIRLENEDGVIMANLDDVLQDMEQCDLERRLCTSLPAEGS